MSVDWNAGEMWRDIQHVGGKSERIESGVIKEDQQFRLGSPNSFVLPT